MTRINVVPPETLTDEHLLAEWRELPRVLSLALDARPVPERYTLGAGHVRFFLPRLGWVGRRHADLTSELLSRGYSLTPRPPLPTTGGDWSPGPADLAVNLGRLRARLAGARRPMRHRGRLVPPTFYGSSP